MSTPVPQSQRRTITPTRDAANEARKVNRTNRIVHTKYAHSPGMFKGVTLAEDFACVLEVPPLKTLGIIMPVDEQCVASRAAIHTTPSLATPAISKRSGATGIPSSTTGRATGLGLHFHG